MKTLLLTVAMVVLGPVVAARQLLPHNIPFLCQGSGDNVPAGQTVTLTGTVAKGCIEVPNGSTLVLGENLNLTVTTIQVLPGGRIATAGALSNATVTWRDQAPTDPEKYGTGLVILGDYDLRGEVTATKVRLAAEVTPGATTVQLASTAGMKVGGQIAFGESRYRWAGLGSGPADDVYVPQIVTITAISGNLVTFTPANSVLRQAARNWDKSILQYPYVGYLTRGLTFVSANPSGSRGHLIITGSATGTIDGAAFVDMGRTTNYPTEAGSQQAGRYATHFHHNTNPGTFQNSAILHSTKWPMSVHQSSNKTIRNNVVYGGQGWGLGTEDGVNENNVTFDGNLVIGITGDGNRGDRGEGEWHVNPLLRGTMGTCFWIQGPLVNLTNNVCMGSMAGFVPWGQRNDGQMDLGTVDRNECWTGSMCWSMWYVAGGTVANQLTVNVHEGTENYPTWRITYKNWVVRCDPAFVGNMNFWCQAFDHGDYSTTDTTVDGLDQQNGRIGTRPAWAIAGDTFGEGTIPRNYRIINSSFCNNTIADVLYYVYGGSSPDYVKPLHTTIFQNNSHCALTPYWVAVEGQLKQNALEPVPVMQVISFNRQVGDDFTVHSNENDPGGTTTRAKVRDRVKGGTTQPPQDSDGDGVTDANDKCPGTVPGTTVDASGCPVFIPPADADNDGVIDANDKCPGTPIGTQVDASGCPVIVPPTDADGDGVPDTLDKCPGTPSGTPVDAAGCPIVVPPVDSDGDGVIDANDKCPGTTPGVKVGPDGCALPPSDPCVATPLRVTVSRWPAGQTGSKSGTWNSGTFALVRAAFFWTPLRFEATDDRGCTVTVRR